MLAFWTGAELSQTSVKAWQSMVEEEGGQAYYVLNGYDEIINHLSQGLEIHLQSPVEHIDYSDRPIKVKVGKEIFEANAVIVTLPIGVLKSGYCKFTPSLPKEKEAAIQAIGCGLLSKTVLEVPYCFWDKEALSIQCLPIDNSPIQYYINLQPIMNKPVLVAMYGGNTVEQMAQEEQSKQKELLLTPLRKIYPKAFIKPRNIFTNSWYNDIFAKGSYSYLPRGQELSCFQNLSKPINDCVFFAGEATNTQQRHASVHGAYETGIRVAEEILQVLN